MDRYRRRAIGSAWLPRVHVAFAARTIDAENATLARILDPTERTVFADDYRRSDTAFVAFLSWDVGAVLAGRDELRVQDARAGLHRTEAELVERASRLYAERARLMLQQMLATDLDGRAATMRSLRVRELTSHLALMTGGLVGSSSYSTE